MWGFRSRSARGEGNSPASDDLAAHIPALKRYFAKRVPPGDVDDLTQDVMLRMQLRKSDAAIDNIQGYLFQVAASVLTDRARRDKVRERNNHCELKEIHHPVEERSPERVLQMRQEVAALFEALGELPDRTRQAFVLHRFEELSYAAIAQKMGISVSGVEKHIMRAMRHLTAKKRHDSL